MAVAKKNKIETMQLGDNIRKQREAQKISQDKLADKTDLSGNAISRYELGETEPGAITLYRIANALGTTADALAPELFAGAGSISPELQKMNSTYMNLPKEKQAIAYQAIMAMLNGLAG